MHAHTHTHTHTHCCSDAVMSDSLWPHETQHARLPGPWLSSRVCSDSRPLSWWCHPSISSSIAPSPPALNLSQHQGLFQWVGSSHHVAKVLEFQYQSLEWIFRVDFLQDWLVWSPCCTRNCQDLNLLQHTVWKHQFFGAWPSLQFTSHICTWLPEKP